MRSMIGVHLRGLAFFLATLSTYSFSAFGVMCQFLPIFVAAMAPFLARRLRYSGLYGVCFAASLRGMSFVVLSVGWMALRYRSRDCSTQRAMKFAKGFRLLLSAFLSVS